MTVATLDAWAVYVARLDEAARARVVATEEACSALRAASGLHAFVGRVRSEVVMRDRAWNGEVRTIVYYPQDKEWIGTAAVAALTKLPDAETTHTPGRVAVVRASARIRCGCHGINTHIRNRNAGCPPGWSKVNLLPRRGPAGGAFYDPHAEPKPLAWECAVCGAFSRGIPLRAGFERVKADYNDHVANHCPGADSPLAWNAANGRGTPDA